MSILYVINYTSWFEGGVSMKNIHSYDYEGIRLQLIEKEDIEEIRLLRNANKDFFFYSKEVTTEEQELWYEKYMQKEDDYMFKILNTSNIYEIIGVVALYDFQLDLAQCEFGRIIINHNKVSEKGVGLKATKCACKIAFEYFQIKKIVLQVLVNNIRAYKTYVNAGFKETGRFLTEGDKIEMICMELLRE